MRISDWSSDVCSSDLIAVDLFEAAQGIAADRQSRRPTASPDQRQKNEAQERHVENAGGYRNKGSDSGDDMPMGNRQLAVRRKQQVKLFNVVFGWGDHSAVNPYEGRGTGRRRVC